MAPCASTELSVAKSGDPAEIAFAASPSTDAACAFRQRFVSTEHRRFGVAPSGLVEARAADWEGRRKRLKCVGRRRRETNG
eukprot:677455-Pleurochrysis_carterae.AAC.1